MNNRSKSGSRKLRGIIRHSVVNIYGKSKVLEILNPNIQILNKVKIPNLKVINPCNDNV